MKYDRKPLEWIATTASQLSNSTNLLQTEANQWVYLRQLPDSFSHDEALLLTRVSEHEWLAWVPDYGEVTLHSDEFYFDHQLN